MFIFNVFLFYLKLFTYLTVSGLSYSTQHLSLHCLVVVVGGLSCPTACGILFPRPAIEPVSPVLQGKFLTTGPPGKSYIFLYFLIQFSLGLLPDIKTQFDFLQGQNSNLLISRIQLAYYTGMIKASMLICVCVCVCVWPAESYQFSHQGLKGCPLHGVLTTGLPGKSCISFLIRLIFLFLKV